MEPRHTLRASASGLSTEEARALFFLWGPNALQEEGGKPVWRMIWEQLTGIMVLVLLGAVGVSTALGDYQDGIVILVIVLINATLGVLQEFRAEKAIVALKQLSSPYVRVLRDGRPQRLPAQELVPGDIVFLETGQIIPADGRLVESFHLKTQEALLTGESIPIDKDPQAVSLLTTPIADRKDMVFQGTLIVHGRGMARIEATGMRTELGHIASTVQKVQPEPTPLQKRLDELARRLVVVILVISATVFLLGLLRGEEASLMFLTSVSIAVAAIPESLPAVVAIALALGAQRMLKRHALVRKLSAVETLGSVTVICTDKTGTLTENRMTVAALDIAGHRLDLSEPLKRGKPVMPEDAAFHPDLHEHPTLALLLAGGALCNDAILSPSANTVREFEASGDPTETALVVAAAQFGLWKDRLEHLLPRQAELAFDSDRKCMSTLHRVQIPTPATTPLSSLLRPRSPLIQFTKGSIERLLTISSHVWVNSTSEPLTAEWRHRVELAVDRLGREGMRVLGIAYREAYQDGQDQGIQEKNLTFIGLLGMHDPIRPDAKRALENCQAAGIRVCMITGDHPTTALAVAQELNMPPGRLLRGTDLQALSVDELSRRLEEVAIFARVAPEDKLKIVEAYKLRGDIVAMTGDGVNDAPALKRADIGVAMGLAGTDVSREAADMVLLNDNFATLVTAIQEGRTIYDNIKKFANYLLTTNSAEIAVMLFGPLLGMPLPLLPLQILWINLITDGPPALALGVEPAEPGVMRRPPRAPQERLINSSIGWHIVVMGLFMAAGALGPGYWLWTSGHPAWQTYIFSTLVFSQLANVLAIRSGKFSLFDRTHSANWALYGCLLGVMILQGLAMLLPRGRDLLKIAPSTPIVFGGSIIMSLLVFLMIEGEKWLSRRRK